MGLLQGVYGAGRRLWNVLGASRHLMTICTIAGGIRDRLHAGRQPRGDGSRDAALLEAHHPLGQQHADHATTTSGAASRWPARQGAHLVVIDPSGRGPPRVADTHLAPIPGTDAALALGLLHVVLAEGAEDRDFIARHTLGWDAFRQRILEYPPERVASISAFRSQAIVELGQRLAHTRPTGIRLTMGLQRHGGGGMAVRTITCIPGVTGDWRHPGGGAGYDTRGFFGVNWPALYRDDLRPAVTRALSMTRLGEGLLEVNDPPVKALFVYASNPLASVPHQTKIRRGLERPDLFTVVVEHFRTDTVEYADLVLPATMQIEHADLQISYGHLYISWNEPAVPPPASVCSSTEIFRRLARRLGLDEPCLYDSDEEMARQVLDSGPPVAPRHHARDAQGARVDAAQLSGAVRAVRRRLPVAVRPARVLLRAHGRGGTGSAGGLHAAVRGGAAGHAARRALPAGADRGGGSLLPELAVRERRRASGSDRAGRRSGSIPTTRRRGGSRPGTRRASSTTAARSSPWSRSPTRVRRGVVASTKGQWPRFVPGGRDRQRHRGRARRRHGRRRRLPRQPRRGRATLGRRRAWRRRPHRDRGPSGAVAGPDGAGAPGPRGVARSTPGGGDRLASPAHRRHLGGAGRGRRPGGLEAAGRPLAGRHARAGRPAGAGEPRPRHHRTRHCETFGSRGTSSSSRRSRLQRGGANRPPRTRFACARRGSRRLDRRRPGPMEAR